MRKAVRITPARQIAGAMRIAVGLLRQEWGSVRVKMGYLLGLTILALGINDFFRYAIKIGEPVNICEAFIVMENQGVAFRFGILGYLLVIADAPFVRGNTYLTLYRCGRRIWNAGMLLYVFMQAFFYTLCFAGISVAASIPLGFPGGLWSSPVWLLATKTSNVVTEKYHVFFDGMSMMRHMTVLQAFGITFFYLLCYVVFLGILLYVCNLISGGFFGLAAVAVVHLGGVFLSAAAWLHQSPAYYVDGAGGHWEYPGRMAVLILILAAVSCHVVGRVDLQAK